MPTEADLLLIQNIKSFSQNLRGAGDIQAQAGQQQFGLQQQQLLQQQARDRQLQDFEAQRQFAVGEREAGQKFRTEQAGVQREFQSEESALGRESREKIAALRKPDTTQINVAIENANQKTLESATTTGFLKQDEETGRRVISGRADEQAKFAELESIDLEDTSDEEFSNPEWRKAHNNKIRDAISVAKKSNQAGAVSLLRSMLISGTATKEEVLNRITSFRKSLIDREVAARMEKEDFTKGISSIGLGGVRFREASASEQAMQRARVEPRIREEVTKQFSAITGP